MGDEKPSSFNLAGYTPQIIHVTVELTLMGLMMYYMTNKIKNVRSEMQAQIDTQTEELKKQRQILTNIVRSLQSPPQPQPQKQHKHHHKDKVKKRKAAPPPSPPSSDDEFDDSELDEELEKENSNLEPLEEVVENKNENKNNDEEVEVDLEKHTVLG